MPAARASGVPPDRSQTPAAGDDPPQRSDRQPPPPVPVPPDDRLGLQQQVRFTGPMYGEDKLAAYVDATVLASAAAYEIFGLVPFEALMCGTPVVVSQESASGELVREAGAGFLVPYGDAGALAEALLQVFADQHTPRRLVVAGQAFVGDQLDWDTSNTKGGIYYYRLEMGDYIIAGKVMVLK